jgi:flagellar protein FliO/FliZ
MIGRLILALGAVLVLMWLLARFARKPLTGKSDRVVTVLARQQLNRNASVAVLKVLDRAFIVGVTDQGVNLLTETDLESLEDALGNQSPKAPRLRGITAARLSADSATEPEIVLEPALITSALAAAPVSTGGHRAARAPRANRATRARRGAQSQPAVRGKSALDGSILSPKTWSQLVNVARDVTVRR